MDLHSDDVFWPSHNSELLSFPELDNNYDCEVIVLGGGITGSLVADAFVKAGVNTIVIDKREIAHGSTSASTALLQYEIDEKLFELTKKIGKKDATTAYELCARSIHYLEEVINTLEDHCDFSKHPSLYLATTNDDITDLKEEFLARKEAGFGVEFLLEEELFEKYKLVAKAAIRSDIGAQLDPYRLTYRLLRKVEKNGGKVFENTKIIDIKTDDKVVVTSENGFTVSAKKIIFAVGYEAKEYLTEKTADLISTYACITSPVAADAVWPERTLLWTTDTPYLYARTTSDNRIIMGGEDIDFVDDQIRDSLVEQKQQLISEAFHKLYPSISFEIDRAWAGTFGITKDALPYIGESPEWRNAYFALGYGGNGITFSAIAAQALVDLYFGIEHEYLRIFRFGR